LIGVGNPATASRSLGTTGLRITAVALGCAALGDMPAEFGDRVTRDRALATIRAALDGGLRLIDTAAIYGEGRSEERLGAVLRARGGVPPGVTVSTKADRDPRSGDFSGAQMRRSVEASLERLGLEAIPLLFLHDPEHTTFAAAMMPGGPVEALVRLRDEGRIHHLGVAGGAIPLLLRFVETGLFEAVITHNRFTLLNRSAEPLLELASARGVAVINAAPYATGLLAKGSATGRYAYRIAPPSVVARAREAEDRCRRYGVPLAAAALALSLREPRIAATIVGMTRPSRVEETLALAATPVPDALLGELAPLATLDDPEAGRWAAK
jgi:D-threo-aldose 1-dehydrogenase